MSLIPASYTGCHLICALQEGGLLGSQAVAKAYEARDAHVYAESQVSVIPYLKSHAASHYRLQFDMTAWVKAGTREEVGIITDFVDATYE